MPRDFLPAVYPAEGTRYRTARAEESMFNCAPWLLHNNKIGVIPRNQFEFVSSAPSSANDRGRGLATFAGEFDLSLDQDTYYYNGGSQDLTATTGNGYAGNTGFNEEYTATFTQHSVSGVANLVIVNAGHTSTNASAKHGNVWYVADASTAPSSISDAHMPGNNGVSLIRGGVSLDGYFFVADINGKIHNSDLNDITSWEETNFLTAERDPDIGIYLGRHHNNIVYIGTRSIEFFYNAGNATGTPLARRADVSYSIGCYFPNAVTQVGDVIYFLGTEQAGWPRIYKLENFQLTVISTPKIEEVIRQGNYPDITELDSLTDSMWLTYVTLHDSPGLILTFDFYGSYYWHEKTNIWSKISLDTTVTYYGGTLSGVWGECLPIVANNSSSGGGTIGRYQLTNGHIIREGSPDNDVMDDIALGNFPDSYLQFAKWDAGTDKKKRVNWVRVVTDSYASDSAVADPLLVELKWAEFDRVTSAATPPDTGYSTGRSIDLNTRGSRVARCGVTRQRQFMIEFTTGHGPLSPVLGLEIDYEIVGE